MLYEDNVVAIQLPNVVELAVTGTTPPLKGATATNRMKDAVVETRLRIRARPFINIGHIVRISTDDGSYLSRAK